MRNDKSQHLSLAERVDALFRAWRESGMEQSVEVVAESVSTLGGRLSATEIADIRSGAVKSVDVDSLSALAQHFHMDPGYLLSDDGGGLHGQLLLLGELIDSGVKGVFLRGDIAQVEMSCVLKAIRTRSHTTQVA
ncbi:hypothetical protein HQ346_14335 [Rhodococcus sp. BP-252]|uniref:hypothetical protein n=1 Tax=unclassified Rhodococcus (in: high G+C Gram-positive bacteria) TaxID=192944 RepID=UPI001C9B34DF|nr:MULTISPECIES: hypothetical protein [unclassified Rhodococcus (in: high G+C Gram-positive bacteria)]MBY6412861.1 hypothetical protein [Rhodococcus sp. BP-320]MBY6417602.1 hypothetical protein [Rhodococcus sp. BP-321]MBY6423454.1 hypothetical protein [Rhodococcus sp. BP-324]MBY6427626.1 hypothetical protein [Rhodococcus sp. BP-323]MBY6432790.1 hypothetical protein [Rhodococcus sp. BP-322]